MKYHTVSVRAGWQVVQGSYRAEAHPRFSGVINATDSSFSPWTHEGRHSRLAFSGSESSLCGIPGNKGGEEYLNKIKACSSCCIKSLCSDTSYLSLDTIQPGVLTIVINEHRNTPPSSCSSNSKQEMLKELFSLWRCNREIKKKRSGKTHIYSTLLLFWVMWLRHRKREQARKTCISLV